MSMLDSGFDVRNCNVNNRVFDEIPVDRLPDVVVVKKVFDRSALHKRRQWKLRRMDINMPDTASVENEFQVRGPGRACVRNSID